MAADEAGAFVRWQGRTITQFGFATNLLLALGTGELAFLFGAALDRREGLTTTGYVTFLMSVVLLAVSVVVGCWLALNRLTSFRTTAQVARHRQNNRTEGIDHLRARTRRLDEWSWCLLWAQVVLFGAGTALMAALAVSLVAGRIQVAIPNQPAMLMPSSAWRPTEAGGTSWQMLRVQLNLIDWQTIGAIATLGAVLVALLPIYREARRTTAHARNLRIRVCSKFTILRPSLGHVIQGGAPKHSSAILNREEFLDVLRSANTMLQESAVLEPEEQDLLSVILANLEMAARLYGSVDFAPESAKSILDLIERLVLVMGEHGLLHGHVDKPWEEEARRNGPVQPGR